MLKEYAVQAFKNAEIFQREQSAKYKIEYPQYADLADIGIYPLDINDLCSTVEMKNCLEHPDKRRFNTQKDAETAVLVSDKKDLRAYNCDTCKGWHLTST